MAKTWLQRNFTLITDTLQTGGRWSIKRVGGVSAFYAAIVYAFVPVWLPKFEPLEFIFWGFITFAGTVIIGSTWEKFKSKVKIKDNDKTDT